MKTVWRSLRGASGAFRHFQGQRGIPFRLISWAFLLWRRWRASSDAQGTGLCCHVSTLFFV
jgi:hypothetical protein